MYIPSVKGYIVCIHTRNFSSLQGGVLFLLTHAINAPGVLELVSPCLGGD